MITCIYCDKDVELINNKISNLGLDTSEINEFNNLILNDKQCPPKKRIDCSIKILDCLERKSSDMSTAFKTKLYECENSIILEKLFAIELQLEHYDEDVKDIYISLLQKFESKLNLMRSRSILEINTYLKNFGIGVLEYIKSALFLRQNYKNQVICDHHNLCEIILNSFIEKEYILMKKNNIDEIIQESLEK